MKSFTIAGNRSSGGSSSAKKRKALPSTLAAANPGQAAPKKRPAPTGTAETAPKQPKKIDMGNVASRRPKAKAQAKSNVLSLDMQEIGSIHGLTNLCAAVG